MSSATEKDLTTALAHSAHRLTGNPHDFDPLLAMIGDAQLVLIGEASHGTHEFYKIRCLPSAAT